MSARDRYLSPHQRAAANVIGRMAKRTNARRAYKASFNVVKGAPYGKRRYKTGKNSSPFPLGQHFSTCLKSAFNYTVNPTATYYNHTFRLNSMFDFDLTTAGTNAQPLGFDELSQFFYEYQVYAIKVKCRWISTVDTPVLIGWHTSNTSSTAYSTIDEIQAAPGMSTKVVTKSSTQDKVAAIKRYSKIHSVLGISKTSYDDVSYLADVGNNPTELAYGQFTVAALDGTTNITGQLLVAVKFYCKFTKRKQLALS